MDWGLRSHPAALLGTLFPSPVPSARSHPATVLHATVLSLVWVRQYCMLQYCDTVVESFFFSCSRCCAGSSSCSRPCAPPGWRPAAPLAPPRSSRSSWASTRSAPDSCLSTRQLSMYSPSVLPCDSYLCTWQPSQYRTSVSTVDSWLITRQLFLHVTGVSVLRRQMRSLQWRGCAGEGQGRAL